MRIQSYWCSWSSRTIATACHNTRSFSITALRCERSTKLAQTRSTGAVFELKELLRQASLPIKHRDAHHRLVWSTWAWLDQNRIDSAGFSTSTTTSSVWIVWRRCWGDWRTTVERCKSGTGHESSHLSGTMEGWSHMRSPPLAYRPYFGRPSSSTIRKRRSKVEWKT